MLYIMEKFIIITEMDLDLWNTNLEEFIKESGIMTWEKEKDFNFFKINLSIKENIFKEKCMDLGDFNGKMEIFIKEIG